MSDNKDVDDSTGFQSGSADLVNYNSSNQYDAIDTDDDILDDDDGIFDEVFAEDVSSDRPARAASDRSYEIPEGAVRTPFGYAILSLEQAIEEHHAEGIHKAAERGESLSADVDVVMLVARGVCPDELDFAHHQSAKSVESALTALAKNGVDLNQVHEGVPAAHRVSEYYGSQIIENYFDKSQLAENGMSDISQGSRLEAFARAGVDFSTKNEKGQSPLEAITAIAEVRAKEENADIQAVKSFVRHECRGVQTAGILQKKYGLNIENRDPEKTPKSAKRAVRSLDG